MNIPFPVFFHIGQDLNLKTKALKAERIKSVALTRPHAVGSVIRVDLGTEFLFVAVTRFMIGQLALINYFATVSLFNALSEVRQDLRVQNFRRHGESLGSGRLRYFSSSRSLAFVAWHC